MRIYGLGLRKSNKIRIILTRLFLLINYFILITNPIQSQSYACEPCALDDCGLLNVKFVPDGGPVFCEGVEIKLINSSTLGFDSFFVDWKDGSLESSASYLPFTHIYHIKDEDLCKSGSSKAFSVCFKGVKYCSSGISCQTGTYTFAIKLRPKAIIDAPIEVCKGTRVNFVNNSCNATEYEWIFGDGSTSSDKIPNKTYVTPGLYSVTLKVSNSCGRDSVTKTIKVVDYPLADFNINSNPSNFCGLTKVTFTNTSNQWSTTKWMISPIDTTKWMFTDTLMNLNSKNIEIFFKKPGVYFVELKATNACGEHIKKDTIEIFERSIVIIKDPAPSCDKVILTASSIGFMYSGSITSFEWTFINGNPSTASGSSFPPVTFMQTGSVQLKIKSPCGDTILFAKVIIAKTESIKILNNPIDLCQNDSPYQLLATPIGGTWKGLGLAANSITPTGLLDPSKLSPGTYSFNYSIGALDCPNDTTIRIQILEPVKISISSQDTVCNNLIFTPKVFYSGKIDSFIWSFPGASPSSSNLSNPSGILYSNPGIYSVIGTVQGSCGKYSDTITIVIQNLTTLIIDPVKGPICSSSTPFYLKANISGGIWSGNGIINSQTGLFNPGLIKPPDQNVTIKYTYKIGACTNDTTIDVYVKKAGDVIVKDEIVCINGDTIILQADKPNGKWGGIGIIDSLLGKFDPKMSGVGDFKINFEWIDTSRCIVNRIANVKVDSLPVIKLNDTIPLCLSIKDIDLNTALNYIVSPPDGITFWSGIGVIQSKGIFNSSSGALLPGFHKVFVNFTRNNCFIYDSAIIQLITNPILKLSGDTTVCISLNFLTLSSNLSGGKWSGPGMDPITGRIDLNIAGGGIHTFNYVFEAGSSCEQSNSVKVEIIDLKSMVMAGSDIEICEGLTRYLLKDAFPANGVWHGQGIIDSLSGEIDLTQLKMDTLYEYRYYISSNNVQNCSAFDSRTFIIHSNPVIEIAIKGDPCINQEFELINMTLNASKYFWDFGDGYTSTAKSLKHAYSKEGNYTVSFSATSDFNCKKDTSFNVFVTTPPIADFDIPIKEGCAPFLLNINNNSSGFNINQSWFINGQTILGAFPGNIYLDNITKDSIFRIILKVSNVCGEVMDSEDVLVHPYPIVDFGVDSFEGCSPLKIEFSNKTLGNPNTFFWDMGNGNMYLDSIPPQQTYTTTDTIISVYNVTLISSNSCGIDTLKKEIRVFPPNVRAFIELDSTHGCQPFTFNPKSYSTAGASLSWKIYNSHDSLVQSSNKSNPNFILNETGVHKIILEASNCGMDSDTAYVNVLTAPEVSFKHDTFVCQNTEVQFINTSVKVSSNFWDFGDGIQSIEISPKHIYSQAGIYEVNLTSYSTLNNCPATYKSKIIVIGKPVLNFSADSTNGCVPLVVNFTNSSQGQGPLNYIWDFGDGSSFSFDKDTKHRFDNPGNFKVKLHAYDSYNCFSDSSIVNIFIYDHPHGNFIFDKINYCHRHDSVFLINKSSPDAVSYLWNIGSRQYGYENPIFLPDTFGQIPITLIATNIYQCSDTINKFITVLESPYSNFAVDTNMGCEDLKIEFINNSKYGLLYTWSFGDKTTSTDKNPSHIFIDSGKYNVKLVVQNINGCPPDSAFSEINVFPKPKAEFLSIKQKLCGAPSQISFNNKSLGSKDYNWDFGDGSFSDLQSPSYEYFDTGIYQVSLIVANEYLCKDTFMDKLNIFGKPLARFDVDPSIGCEDLDITLLNTSTQSLSYKWYIESIGLIKDESPRITFKDPGIYDIQLVAMYNNLCQDSISIINAVTVYESPEASFRYVADSLENIIGDVQFYNLSIKADRYFWDLGDKSNSTDFELSHEYDINRSIKVILTAYNDNKGLYTCVDTAIMDINPQWIKTFYAPNAFTPGFGQGFDVFKPVGIGLKEYEIAVYSPWGEQVWFSNTLEKDHPREVWDGNYKGKIVPQGSYVWLARLKFVDDTDRIAKGTVTVLR